MPIWLPELLMIFFVIGLIWLVTLAIVRLSRRSRRL